MQTAAENIANFSLRLRPTIYYEVIPTWLKLALSIDKCVRLTPQLWWMSTSDDSICQKYRYIVHDISYRIISSKNIEFFFISR